MSLDGSAPAVRAGDRDVIRVLIADDLHMVRGALVALLGREHDIEIVEEVDHGDLIAAAERSEPDVAILDFDRRGPDGLTGAEVLRARLPQVRMLVLTGLSQPGHLLRALKIQVHGYIHKGAPARALADAVRQVAAGARAFDPELVARALETGDSPLTPRETDVLRAAGSGLPTEAIARELALSRATVRNYISNAIAKLGGRNRIDAIRIARDAGWL